MAQNDRITEIVSPKAQEQVVQLDANLRKILTTYNELAKASQKIVSLKQGNDVNRERIKLDQEALKNSKLLAQAKKAEADAEAAIERAKRASLQTEKLKNSESVKTRGANNTNLAQLKSLNSAYQQQSRLLNDLRQRQKDLNIQKVQGAKLTKAQESELKRLTIQVRDLDANLKRVDAAAGQFQRNVGNYPKVLGTATKSFRAFIGAFGFTSGILLFVQTLKETFKIFAEFDQAQADLAAVLGKSRKEISKLTKQAKELGSTTAFTATQVAQLQLELSKLGFSEDQILASAEAIEQLAIATGVDAARAAKLAGAAIRGFNLDAEEAIRVSSVLAVSTTKSASSFETLEVALPKVSAIAKAFNFTIEDTVALLSGLQNAGFEASIAGTSLRQIFLQLADSNGKLAKRLGGNVNNFDELVEALKRVEGEGIDLAEAFELTNARSVAAFKVFLQGADDLKVLRDSITDVNSELDKLAETKLDSLKGEVTLLNSAWEGLVLSIEDGTGSISKFFRGAVKGIRSVFELLKDLNSTPEELQDAYNKALSLEAYEEELTNLKIETIKTGKTINEVARDNFFKFRSEADAAREEVERIKNSIDNANKIIKQGGPAAEAYSNEIEFLEKDLETAGKRLAIVEGRLKAVNESMRKNTIDTEENSDAHKTNNEFLNGTIAFYNDYIKAQQELRDKTSRTNEEYEQFNRNIDIAKGKIEALQGVYKALDFNIQIEGIKGALSDLPFIEEEDQEIEYEIKVFLDTAGVDSILQQLADRTGKTFDEIKEQWANVNDKNFENSLAFADKYISLQEEIKEKQSQIYDGIVDVVGKSFSSILELQVNKLDEQLEANNRYYDSLLEKEGLTELERTKIQQAKEAREEQIRKKREKIEKQQFLLNQLAEAAFVTMDMFKAIAAIKAQAAILASNPVTAAYAPIALSQIPLVLTSSGLAVAGILAQSIPQFFKGKEASDNYQGWATVNELPGQRELKIDKYGGVTAYKAGMQLDYVHGSDIIVPNMTTFNREIKDPTSDIFKRLSQRINMETSERTQAVSIMNSMDTSGIEAAVERAMLKYVKRPLVTKVKVEYPDNYNKY